MYKYPKAQKDARAKWVSDCRTKALSKTAKHYHIRVTEVKELLHLAAEYFKDTIDSIDMESDLFMQPNRFRIPGFGGYIAIKKLHIINNMYKHGHISKEQWDKLQRGVRSKGFEKMKNTIDKFNLKVKENE